MSSVSEALRAQVPYDRESVTAGWAHFGVGNFHRAHQALYVDRVLAAGGDLSWGIAGIGISDGDSARAKAERFASQDCLYTLTEFSPDGTNRSQVVGALIDYLHAPADPERVLSLLADQSLRIVSLTITEGGYLLDESTGDFLAGDPSVQADLAAEHPSLVFGYLVRALARRRAAGVAPFTVVSCDNLRQNGATTRRAVVGYAAAVDPDLAQWIEAEVAFPNSMVDRIVPYVSRQQRENLNAASGFDDQLPVMGESYLQWVIEDEFPAGRPALETVGVQLRPDVHEFEAVKGRMLNAAHMLLSYPSLLLGHRYVHDAMADERIRTLLDTFLTVDAIPLLSPPEGVTLVEYKDMILDRFANPAVRDQIIRIATDGAAKLPVFHTRTVQELLERGTDVRREAFLFACYQRYLTGHDDAGEDLGITEPSLTEQDWAAIRGGDPLAVLSIPTFVPLGLAENPAFVADFLRMRELMASGGVDAAIQEANRV